MLYDPKWEVDLDNETVAVLKRAKALIANKSRWTKGEYAKSIEGGWANTESIQAARFCSVGALARVTATSVHDAEKSQPCRFLAIAAREKGFSAPHDLNDGANHAVVMAMFDRAIELARSGA